jgi:hypothetical protein
VSWNEEEDAKAYTDYTDSGIAGIGKRRKSLDLLLA